MTYAEYVRKLNAIRKLTDDLATDLEFYGCGDDITEMHAEVHDLKEAVANLSEEVTYIASRISATI